MPIEYTTRNRLTTALIIPALNEDAVIGEMLAALPKGQYDQVVVSDNGSSDRTADVAHAAGATVVEDPERGYGAACLRAIEVIAAGTDVVVFMQADLSEFPEEAALLLAPIEDGTADLVLGSRTIGGGAEPGSLLPHQEFGNKVASFLIRILFGHSYSDLGPYRAIRMDALRRLGMRDRNYGWTVEMQVRALQQGLRVVELPVRYRLRRAGINKVSGNLKASLRAGWKILSTVVRLWLSRGGD